MMSNSAKSILTVSLLAVVAITIGILTQQSHRSKTDVPTLKKAIILPQPKPLAHVDFIDHKGRSFGIEQLRGYWNILFFGFTNCPDICPTTLQMLKQVKNKLVNSNRWGNYQVVLVTVDPKRDTPEQLNSYVPYFDPEFIGITGELDTTTEFAKQLGVLFVSHESEGNANYDVDHSAAIILVNPQGQMAGVITAPHKMDEISADLIALADYYKDDHQYINQPAVKKELAVAPGQTAESGATPDINGLQINNAWIRAAPEGATSMAAYFELINNSDRDITIVDSDSPDFDMSMIHDTKIENGIASMHHRDKLVVPANDSVRLAPLGTHMMLMRPVKALKINDRATITLIADDGSNYTQQIPVLAQAVE